MYWSMFFPVNLVKLGGNFFIYKKYLPLFFQDLNETLFDMQPRLIAIARTITLGNSNDSRFANAKNLTFLQLYINSFQNKFNSLQNIVVMVWHSEKFCTSQFSAEGCNKRYCLDLSEKKCFSFIYVNSLIMSKKLYLYLIVYLQGV